MPKSHLPALPIRLISEFEMKMFLRSRNASRIRRSKYSGEALRSINAKNGVGRPPKRSP